MNAAAARAGVPIALKGEQIAIVPASYGIDHLPRLLKEFATVFLLKVHLAFDRLLDILERLERPPEGCYLENIGTPLERVVTDLPSLRGQKLPYFSLVILTNRERQRP
jgi:precorrin-2 methylase